MVTDEKLLRCLMRTAACVRRRPLGKEGEAGEKGLPFGKGFGHILDLLTVEDGVSQQQLADRIGIRPQSVSEAISAMEGHGLVRREPSTEDRRVMLIYVTPEGAEYHKTVSRERRERAKNFFSALSREEKETLFSLLEKLTRDEKKKEEG